MKQVTIFRHSDSSAGFTIWADENNPTTYELTPNGADIVVYQKLPNELITHLLETTRVNASNILSDYLP